MKLQQPENLLSIHICTKDRPDRLSELLADIDAVIQTPKRVFVYDDSTAAVNKQQNQDTLEAMPYPTVHVDEQTRQDLLSHLSWPSQIAETYADYAFKELGKPEWDLAGVRAFAHFIAAVTTDHFNKILFLDDDIGLQDGVFQNERIHVDSKTISAMVPEFIPWSQIIGAQYVGREDTYIVDHLSAPSWSADNFYTRKIDNNEPPRLSRGRVLLGKNDFHRTHGGLPISGGFLLMRASAVCEVALPHCFNEDQIFITAFRSMRQNSVMVAPFRPLHKGDTITPDLATIKTQQSGATILKAFQQAIFEIDQNTPGFADRALTLCQPYAQEEVAKWRKVTPRLPAHLLDSHAAEELLDEERIVTDATDILRAYFKKRVGWHDLATTRRTALHIQKGVAAIEQR